MSQNSGLAGWPAWPRVERYFTWAVLQVTWSARAVRRKGSILTNSADEFGLPAHPNPGEGPDAERGNDVARRQLRTRPRWAGRPNMPHARGPAHRYNGTFTSRTGVRHEPRKHPRPDPPARHGPAGRSRLDHAMGAGGIGDVLGGILGGQAAGGTGGSAGGGLGDLLGGVLGGGRGGSAAGGMGRPGRDPRRRARWRPQHERRRLGRSARRPARRQRRGRHGNARRRQRRHGHPRHHRDGGAEELDRRPPRGPRWHPTRRASPPPNSKP